MADPKTPEITEDTPGVTIVYFRHTTGIEIGVRHDPSERPPVGVPMDELTAEQKSQLKQVMGFLVAKARPKLSAR